MKLSNLRTDFRDRILDFASECGVVSVKVFGSTVRGDATDKSDIDLLISAKKTASLLDIGRFKWKVEELLHRKVDIVFEGHVHRSIADQIMKEAQPL
ncbi:MAG: nucleotidyltransferase domain-containing protein [Holosporaceae bacterium]|jgi:predicted nucleotidyltransferase|nr:nucleotidyltransferase domain-containing protein [Holosporaceae bacterium]